MIKNKRVHPLEFGMVARACGQNTNTSEAPKRKANRQKSIDNIEYQITIG